MISIPTTQQLYAGIVTNLESEYGVNISVVGKSAIRAIAAVQAAKLKLFYLVIGNLQKNIFVDTADPESTGGTLERFGRVKLGRNPYQAVAGQYVIQVTGTIGGVIKAGTVFKSDDSSLSPGMLYILDNAYTLVSTTDSITVRSLTPGTTAKLIAADTLTSTIPIALVNSGAQVLTEAVQPLAAEGIEDYRQKTINAFRVETQGGSPGDYRIWAADAQGVERVYPYVTSGVDNEINLYVEATLADSTDGKGTPSAQLLLDVEDVVELDPDTTLPIDDRGRRPMGIFEVHYLPVVPQTVAITITGNVGFTVAQKQAIDTALQDAINAVRPFIAGADVLAEKNDFIDNNKLVGIIITANPGGVFTSATFTVAGTPLSTYTFADGFIPYYGGVTYN
jgi:hypothetical protein